MGITVQVVTRTVYDMLGTIRTSVVAVYDSPHAAGLFVNSEHAPIVDSHGNKLSYEIVPMTVLDMNRIPVEEKDERFAG